MKLKKAAQRNLSGFFIYKFILNTSALIDVDERSTSIG